MPAKKRKCRARRAKAVPVKIFIGGIYAVGVPSIIMVAIGSVMYYLMNKICHAVRILLYGRRYFADAADLGFAAAVLCRR